MQDMKETGDKRKIYYRVLALLITAVLCYCLILTVELKRSGNTVEEFRARTEELAKQNEELLLEKERMIKENAELQEKVEILSDTVNGKVRQEREREAEIAQTYIPTGFPLEGKATYSESEKQLNGNPITVFHASPGNSVVATANGTVSSVAGEVGAGYVVMIDHGNGYVTVYRNGARPKVDEGDTVTKTTKLFDINAENGTLGYQIIENDKYIDPLSFMETSG